MSHAKADTTDIKHDSLSLASRGARHQIGVAICLITIIPLLSLAYMMLVVTRQSLTGNGLLYAVAGAGIGSIILGFAILCRFPINLARLRRYLEELVQGELHGDVKLLPGISDVPAIEQALRLIVAQLNERLVSMQAEVSRVETLLRPDDPAHGVLSDAAEPPIVFLQSAEERESGVIYRCLGDEVLGRLMSDFLDLAASAGAIYEASGTLVMGVAISAWARTLAGPGQHGFTRMTASTVAGITPDGPCSWAEAAHLSMAQRAAVECLCDDGLRLYFAPIVTRNKVVGAAGFSFGDPPTDDEATQRVAERYGVPTGTLQAAARAHTARPSLITSLAKSHLVITMELMGEVIERRMAELELRDERRNLESTVQKRTRELHAANEHLQKEIDERKRAEMLKDEFVSTISHELRTPLAITKEGIELLLDGIPGNVNDKQAKVLVTAKGNIERLGRIINDLLDISKIEAGKIDMDKDRVELPPLADLVLQSLSASAQQRGLTLKTQVDGEIPAVYADDERLIQILTNLVSNAIKFTESGGIRIHIGQAGGMVTCCVADTGIGLTTDQVKTVFDKFVQFGRTDGAGQRGTGLGLAIAKRIVELHRGTIRAESEVGVGSRFTFTLPVYSEQEVIRELIEESISQSRIAHDNFILLLFRLDPNLRRDDTATWKAFQRGIDRLVDLQHFVRSSDRMSRRRDDQILMIAKVTPTELPGLYRRWMTQVNHCFHEEDPQLDVSLYCGYAQFPDDGSTADELLAKADGNISHVDLSAEAASHAMGNKEGRPAI